MTMDAKPPRAGRRLKKVWLVAGACVLFACVIAPPLLVLRAVRGLVGTIPENVLTVGKVGLRWFSVQLSDVRVSATRPFLNLGLSRIDIRPSLGAFFRGRVALAFSGPGEADSDGKKSAVTFSGSLTGNLKTGAVRIRKTTLVLEHLGTVEATGDLGRWGQDTVALNVTLGVASLKKVGEFFGAKLPCDGKASGTMALDINQETKVQKVRFALKVSDVIFTETAAVLDGDISGTHDFAEHKTVFDESVIRSRSGGRLVFSGTIEGEEFAFSFRSEGLTVEEVIQFFPEEFRKKIAPEQVNGTVNSSSAELSGSKKNFASEEILPSPPMTSR